MSSAAKFLISPSFSQHAYINDKTYAEWYRMSIDDSETFWAQRADQFLSWFNRWDRVSDCDFANGRIRWFDGGKLNVAYNCLDRHLPHSGDRVALIWEGDLPGNTKRISFRELHEQVCRLANVLRSQGVMKGDRVAIYLPMIPEGVIAMLACARIGAVHSVVFGGFSAVALRERILDCECRIVITADSGSRAGKSVPLKDHVDTALQACPEVATVIVVKHGGNDTNWVSGRDVWYHEAMAGAEADCPCEEMSSEDPLFILYTSGSTGRPKGVVHTTAGYLLYAAMTQKYVFDCHDTDVYWCTADIGWITGHSYVVYGPLCNGATSLLFEGVPTFPDAGRLWQIVDDHAVSIFYTAPTAIRALMAFGDEPLKQTKRSSLRVLGTVGEPINPEAWDWYHRAVGQRRCPIVDTWWQTETGGILITALPGATELKPGSAALPFFGVQATLLDEGGAEISGPGQGALVIAKSWPGQMRTIYKDHQRFVDAYLSPYPGYYFSGDGARRDEDGYYWITGRIDDVINVAGHRLGTAEVESALVLHESVAEAAVVGYPHPVKGQGIYAYVTLMHGIRADEALRKELIDHVRREIGPIATPDVIQWAPGLPKTRSGKIMRRILRKVAATDIDDLGDISTLADPAVVKELIHGMLK